MSDRYGGRDNATTRSTVNRTQLAGLPYVEVLDTMRRTSDFVPLAPQPAPQPTRSMRVKLGFLVGAGACARVACPLLRRRPRTVAETT